MADAFKRVVRLTHMGNGKFQWSWAERASYEPESKRTLRRRARKRLKRIDERASTAERSSATAPGNDTY
jgi:hypothetical protein